MDFEIKNAAHFYDICVIYENEVRDDRQTERIT